MLDIFDHYDKIIYYNELRSGKDVIMRHNVVFNHFFYNEAGEIVLSSDQDSFTCILNPETEILIEPAEFNYDKITVLYNDRKCVSFLGLKKS